MAKELYVGHISENASEEDILKLFSVMGTVTSVHLIIDPETGEFKRCGYVRMASEVDLQDVAESLDGALLVDRVITVSIARPQIPGMGRSSKPGGARKTGGQGRGVSNSDGSSRTSGENSGQPRGTGSRQSIGPAGNVPERSASRGGQGRSGGASEGQERSSGGQGRSGAPDGKGRNVGGQTRGGGTGGSGRGTGGAAKGPRKGR